MGRPKTKTDLILAANEQFASLWALTDTMNEKEKNADFITGDRDKNLRDIITHLYEWHSMFLIWYTVGMRGEKPVMPAAGYSWKTTPELNAVIWQKYQDTSLEEAVKLLNESHERVMELIEKHSNDELFEKGVYKWTNTTSLGAYLVSSTSSHYDWAIKKIKKHLKNYRNR